MTFWPSAILSLLLGAAIWSLANFHGGKFEPWDSENFAVFYFLACAASFGLGAVCRERAWVMGFLIIAPMLPVMLILNPDLGPLLFVGLFFLIVLSVPAIVSATLGAAIRNQIRKELP